MRLGAFFEILPLVGFFIAFHYLGLLPAAAISVGLGLLVLVVARFRDQRFAKFPLFSLIISALFTLAALLFDAAVFVKIQPTCQWGICSNPVSWAVEGAGCYARVLGDQFDLTESGNSSAGGPVSLVLAVANELAWRLLDEADWVAYKTFVAAPASMIFMLLQLPLTLRGQRDINRE